MKCCTFEPRPVKHTELDTWGSSCRPPKIELKIDLKNELTLELLNILGDGIDVDVLAYFRPSVVEFNQEKILWNFFFFDTDTMEKYYTITNLDLAINIRFSVTFSTLSKLKALEALLFY